MNILRKIYCRTYQKIFKLAIPILPYTSPEITETPEDAAELIQKRGLTRLLIVTDKFIHESGLITPLKDALTKRNIAYVVFDETMPNPTISTVEAARDMYIKSSCRGLIGFGGGSSIDCAKAVGARIAKPKKTIQEMRGILSIHKKTPFVLAVPTTAGTGSEVTVTTVVTNSETGEKFPISDFPLIPDAVLHDPKNTVSLPKHLTAATGMDALTHAVEAYIGGSAVKSTKADAIRATRLIFENIKDAYNNGENLVARKNMLEAAFLAGRAFSKSYVGYCHAVAHSLGGKYNIPHGLANSVILPYTLEAYGDSVYNKLYSLTVAVGICDASTDKETAAKAFIEKIKEMNREMNIPEKLSGIKEEDIPILAEIADKEANPLYPVPKLMDKYELRQFYYSVMEETV
ncbi:MAG: iron-containing alcohol dehydrogenase [Ruminococcaceae bacterium]|nr:iron-containing alcohol dehydrogenase [Oscillospiraceae bacterium]